MITKNRGKRYKSLKNGSTIHGLKIKNKSHKQTLKKNRAGKRKIIKNGSMIHAVKTWNLGNSFFSW